MFLIIFNLITLMCIYHVYYSEVISRILKLVHNICIGVQTVGKELMVALNRHKDAKRGDALLNCAMQQKLCLLQDILYILILLS